MAISLSGFKQKKEKETVARKLAEETARQRKKEGGFGGLLSLLSIPLAFATGGISSAIFGTGAKGLLAGLGKAVIGAGLKTGSEKILRGAGMGADPSKIQATNRYGFGRQEAEDIRGRMKEGIEERGAHFDPGSLLSSVIMDYAGKFAPKFGEEGTTAAQKASKAGAEAAEGDFNLKKFLFGAPGTEGDVASRIGLDATPDVDDLDYDPNGQSYEIEDFQQGGLVPKYYGGGNVPLSGQSPTISDYFNMQGKSLGGSNKKSLAEMLGRR